MLQGKLISYNTILAIANVSFNVWQYVIMILNG